MFRNNQSESDFTTESHLDRVHVSESVEQHTQNRFFLSSTNAGEELARVITLQFRGQAFPEH